MHVCLFGYACPCVFACARLDMYSHACVYTCVPARVFLRVGGTHVLFWLELDQAEPIPVVL